MVGQTQKNLEVTVEETNFDCFKRLCYLRQDDNCVNVKKMQAGELLRTNAILYGASSSRLQVVEENISEFKDTPVGDLSGGQKRRLAVCSALLLKPRLIVLDEALSGLDSVSAIKLLQFIVAIAKKDGCSIVMSIHAPSNETARILGKGKLIVLEGGRIHTNASFDRLSSGRGSDVVPELVGMSRHESMLSATTISSRVDCFQTHIHSILKSTVSGEPTSQFGVIDDEFEIVRDTDMSQEYKRPNLPTAVFALTSRLRREFGIALVDFVRLPVSFVILAGVLSWDAGSPTQVLLATVFFFGMPFQVFRYKVSIRAAGHVSIQVTE